jgi:hypothetical protein
MQFSLLLLLLYVMRVLSSSEFIQTSKYLLNITFSDEVKTFFINSFG